MRYSLNVLAAALFLAASAPAWGHHSAAMFDASKQLDVTGTVKEFKWTNPHSWLLLESHDPAGKMVEFNVEANGPGYLVRQGWKRESLKPGDNVTITLNPMRDGSPGGNLVKAVLANGQQLTAMPKIPGLSLPGTVQK
jgi:hypothetical protein